MKLDLFTEIQDPKPWTADHEARRIRETLMTSIRLIGDLIPQLDVTTTR